MRRFMQSVWLMIVLAGVMLPSSAAALYHDGDVAPHGSRDGVVNVGDALVCLRFALGLETPTADDLRHGDVAPLGVDGQPQPDGVINVGDALVILRKAVGLESFVGQADPLPLPDTGQTLCYDTPGNVINCADTGQDGAYEINPKSYTDNGNGTISDNVTDLIWQQSDDDQWRNWDDAVAYCGQLSLGGSTDWRLPTILELQGLVDYGRENPSINPVFNSIDTSSGYWSSTSRADNPATAWFIRFHDGYVGNNGKTDGLLYVRCVR